MPVAASVPSAGLPGLDPRMSRIVATRAGEWHVLDTAPVLEASGIEPTGTLLCVHGNPTWSYLWRELVNAATDAAHDKAPAWRVIAVDQLEMGFSERSDRARTLVDRVRDLGELTETIGLTGPVVTVGHDWGGPVSLGWALDHQESLAGVVLLNTAVHHPDGRAIPAALRLALLPGVRSAATEFTPAFLETTLALAKQPLASEVKAAYRAPYRGADRRRGIRDFVLDIPADASHASAAELDRIAAGVAALQVPALLLRGPEDPVFGEEHLHDLVGRLPHADVHRFEGAGHLLVEDVDYSSVVLEWVDDLPVAPALDDLVETGAAPSPHADEGFTPLWRELERAATSEDRAIIDMAANPDGSARVIPWSLLAQRVDRLARGFAAIGMRPGDRISLLVPPSADLTAIVYAALRVGAVAVVADAGLGLRGLGRAVRGARPDFVIGAQPGLAVAAALRWPGRRISVPTLSRALARTLGVERSIGDVLRAATRRASAHAPREPAAIVEPAPDDLAAILFTSGSTGPAKGVRYTHRQLSALRGALAAQYDVGPGTGLVAGFAPFALLGPALGARSVAPEGDVTAPRTLTARAVADAATAADATALFLSPAALANVVATAAELDDGQRAALDRVRTVLSAGAPVPVPLLERVAAMMPSAGIHTPYGMTEGLLLTDVTLEGIREAMAEQPLQPANAVDSAGGVCVGTAIDGVEIWIRPLDADGHPTGELTRDPGVTGEIVASARHLRDGYDRLWMTERIASALTEPGVRRHSTGDVGHLDADGRLWIEGRLHHVVTTADGVVTPVGIEQRLESLDEVRRAALVGVGPAGAQVLVVVAETEPPRRSAGLAHASLAAAVRRVAGRPIAAVLVVPTLPTDIRHNSKIDRTALAAWADAVLRGDRIRRP